MQVPFRADVSHIAKLALSVAVALFQRPAHSLSSSSRFLRGLFFIMLAISAFMSLIYTLLPLSLSFSSRYSAF
jgi:hypothetical protein